MTQLPEHPHRVDTPLYQRRTREGIVALADAAGVAPINQPTSGFRPHENHTMSSPRVFAIYWGRTWGSAVTGMNANAVSMNSFLVAVLKSNYMDWIAQYGSGRGTFLGFTWVDHAPLFNQTLTPSDIVSLLTGWIDSGVTGVVPDTDETNLL